MLTETDELREPSPRLAHRQIGGRDARVAIFNRAYDASIEDVWDACTNPARLSRWYVPVQGDLRVGGHFQQAMMGSGVVVECDPPHRLKVSLVGGADEIELALTATDHETTALELQHATTLDTHEIQGQVFDAVFCMGGGYYPRFAALASHLRGALPEDYDPLTVHLDAEMRPIIDRGSHAMAKLLGAGAKR